MNVLLVDHSAIYRNILQESLRGFRDLELSFADSAADARQVIRTKNFHFAIVSGHLTDGDGVELVRELRASGQLDFDPIVLLTGTPTTQLAEKAEQAGVTEIFRKQDIGELVSFLRRFLHVHAPLEGRVLYVEDANDQRMALESQLRAWNLNVDAYPSADEAWEAFVVGDYDLVITDVVLAGKMTGSRLVNRIRRLNGRKGDIPILALTAFDTPAKRIELFHLGIDDYISKPVQMVELRARIHSILARKQVTDRNRLLLQASSLAVAIVNEAGLISTVNEELEQVFGHAADQLIGQPLAILFDANTAETGGEFIVRHLQPLSQGTPHGLRSEGMGCRHQGQAFAIRFSVIEIARSIGQREFAVLIQDISAERELEARLLQAKEEAEAATQLKSQFLANMSHEIRTPMNGILGMLHLALDGKLPDAERNFVTKAHDSANFLLGVLNDILDFSKIEAGKLQFEALPFSLDSTLNRVDDQLRLRAEQKGLAFKLDCNPDVPRGLVGDPLRLTQVLTNLIGNSLKFTHSGGVSLSVSLLEHDTAHQRVHLAFAIRDTGIGFDPAQKQRLFAPFDQAKASTSREYGGSGLGLAISRHLVQRMGGTIDAESTPGQGSLFHFDCWFDLAAPGTIELQASQGVTIPPELAGLRILLVEDNPVNQEIAAHYLQNAGIDVCLADNGLQALEILERRENSFAAVLMDIQMPMMDGFATTQAIRKKFSDKQLPVIAMTANAMSEDQERCLTAGMQDYIPKPVDRARLYATLVRCSQAQNRFAALNPAIEAPIRSEAELVPSAELSDFSSALRRMGGDQAMYRRITKAFFEKHGDVALRIGDELRAGLFDDARRRAHTLKGLAGTLGADRLRITATKLEHACEAETPKEAQAQLIAELGERMAALRIATTQITKGQDH